MKVGMIVEGSGFKLELLETDPPRARVVHIPKRNLHDLKLGQELQFEICSDSDTQEKYKTKVWLRPEKYAVGTMTDYVGGWFLTQDLTTGEISFEHSIP